MQKNKNFIYVFCSVLMLIMQSFLFCSTHYAGGSEIGNPCVLTGMVTDSSGRGLSNVTLYLVDPMQTDPKKLLPDSCYTAYSRTDGVYSFSAVYKGIYNLLGINSSGDKMFLKRIEITNLQKNNLDNDTVASGADTLEVVANVVVALTECVPGDTVLFFVPGTVIRVTADTCGEYIIRCPSSIIDVVLCRNDSLTVLGDDISVEAGQWVDLTEKKYDVPAPQFESGLISGLAGQLYSFSAGGITLGPNHPVQYRFDWGDSISPWSLFSQNSHVWNEPGNYQVRVQAGSVRDTLSVSEWSDAVDLTIQ